MDASLQVSCFKRAQADNNNQQQQLEAATTKVTLVLVGIRCLVVWSLCEALLLRRLQIKLDV